MTGWRWHDMHVHTRPHSPDAHWRATLPAMLKQAISQGVTTVGLANHFFPGTDFSRFMVQRELVRTQTPPGMTVWVGAELCVLDSTGAINLTAAEASQLDFVLGGPHHFRQRWVEPPLTGSAGAFVARQQQTLLAAVQNPLLNGLAHPWVINIQHAQRRWDFSPEAFLTAWPETLWAELGAAAAQHHTALEIGMGLHFMAEHQGEVFWQKYRRGLQAAKAAGAKFYFGSDAHHLHVIARLDWLEPTLIRLGFGPDDIIWPAVDWVKKVA